MAHGVTGNTSVFGTEESRFEPWWANSKKNLSEMKGFFLFWNLWEALLELINQGIDIHSSTN
jgi:hypothetical protein